MHPADPAAVCSQELTARCQVKMDLKNYGLLCFSINILKHSFTILLMVGGVLIQLLGSVFVIYYLFVAKLHQRSDVIQCC